MSKIQADTTVKFDAIRLEDSHSGSLRVVIPKMEFMIVAEDTDYYYLQQSIHYGVPADSVQEMS